MAHAGVGGTQTLIFAEFSNNPSANVAAYNSCAEKPKVWKRLRVSLVCHNWSCLRTTQGTHLSLIQNCHSISTVNDKCNRKSRAMFNCFVSFSFFYSLNSCWRFSANFYNHLLSTWAHYFASPLNTRVFNFYANASLFLSWKRPHWRRLVEVNLALGHSSGGAKTTF